MTAGQRPSPIAPTPRHLLVTADELLTVARPGTEGLWARAVAILCRQALEGALVAFWRDQAPGVEAASFRAQLLCLRTFVDPDLAARSGYAWAALSAACHHHPYDLAPTASELGSLYATVESIVRAFEADPPRHRDPGASEGGSTP